jgi:nitrous oxidase accessory protein
MVERKAISGIMLTLLLIGLLTLALNVQPVRTEPSTIRVPDDYPTIQEAINRANPGDTVFVKSGIYREHLVVNKTVSIVGQDETSTYIYGNTGSVAVHIIANGIIFTGFTVRSTGGPYDNGICLSNVKDCNVSGNNVQSSFFGIEILSCSKCILENDHTWSNSYGIGGASCSNCSVSRNVATGNENGIAIDMSSSMVIKGNELNENHIAGFWSDYPESNNCIVDNSVMNNLYGIGLNHDNNDSVIGNCITGNTIVHNQLGIVLVSSPHTSVTQNQISQNFIGVELESSLEDNCITNNSITNNNEYGIWLSSSSGNSIIGNDISDNKCGLGMANSSRNTVHHDNFINNTSQVYEQESTNSWDNGYLSGGNYWSDYVGADLYNGPYQNVTGNDGFGDMPYIIDANNKDRYPLMIRWRLGDVNRDGAINVLDLIVVAKTLGTHPGDPKWNPNADVNDDGEIDVLDLILVAKYLGT